MNNYSIGKENLTIQNFGEIYSIPFEESYWRYNKKKKIHPIPLNYQGILTLQGKKYELGISEGPTYIVKDIETSLEHSGPSCQEAFSKIFKERKIKEINPIELFGFENKEVKEKLNNMIRSKVEGYLKRKLESLGYKEEIKVTKETPSKEEEIIVERGSPIKVINETIEIEEIKHAEDDDLVLNCSQDLGGFIEEEIEALRKEDEVPEVLHESNELTKVEKESERSELIKIIDKKKDIERVELLSEQSKFFITDV